MNSAFRFSLNEAGEDDIVGHLALCDANFIPPLSRRVDLRVYARKIVDRAFRFEAWAAGQLIGLVAVYGNDPAHRNAFVTSVSVLPEWQGRGIAVHLLGDCIRQVRALGFGGIELEVDRRNTKAIGLYERQGFKTTGEKDPAVVMRLNLENDS